MNAPTQHQIELAAEHAMNADINRYLDDCDAVGRLDEAREREEMELLKEWADEAQDFLNMVRLAVSQHNADKAWSAIDEIHALASERLEDRR